MKLRAIEKIYGFAFVWTMTLSLSSVSGQNYNYQVPESNGAETQRLPLNQLPPIVTSNQGQQPAQSMLQPSKSLYLPEGVGNLPPIVSPNSQQPPFIYRPTQTAPATTAAPTPQNQVAPVVMPSVSRGGVPIYNNVPPQQPGQPEFRGNSIPANNSRQLSNGSSLPPIVSSTPSTATKSLYQDFNDSLAPAELPNVPDVELDVPGSVVETPNSSALPFSPLEPAPSVVPGTSSYFSPTWDQSQIGGTSNHGCSSCGPDGCYDPAMVQSQMGCCGSVVNAGYYLFAEGLYWTRSDGDVQLSNFFGLADFDSKLGGRFTLGYRQNATQGRELTYIGTGDLDQSVSRTNAAGALNPLFNPVGGIGFAQTSAFFNAVLHTQSKTTQLQSLEYNRINWGWDVVKSFIGLRYIYFDDSYSFFSTNMGGTNGLFVMDSVNNFFGAHTGFELFYDVGYRTSFSLTGKFGGYINSADFDTNLFNGGIQILGNEAEATTIASSVEFGFLSHFQLSPRSRLRLGYDVFMLFGAYTVENNIPRDTFSNGMQIGVPLLSPNTGTDLNTNNEPVLFNGVTFGFEVFR